MKSATPILQTVLFTVVLVAASAISCFADDEPAGRTPFVLEKGDHIVLVGNALAERMQHHGWLESYLQAQFPQLELVVRNHGFSGDQVADRPRNQGFIDPHTYLEISKASVIFAFFGYNESYDDRPEVYRQQLAAFVDETRAHQYDGKRAPRIVLFAPIAHENLHDPNLPSGAENNVRLEKYAAATREVARDKKVAFVDAFAISQRLYAAHDEALTMNGIHLTSDGDRYLAEAILAELLGKTPVVPPARLEAIRCAVLDKNWHWYQRYRATDGNDIWGGRAGLKFVDGQSNRDVLWHELTMIDVMTANRDRKVWAEARGDSSYRVDDSNVPPPVRVKSNVGGGSASSSQAKEGQLSYMTPDETLAQLKLADGYQANIFASEVMFPELANPVQMAVDTRGRLWVAAWKNYPKWEPLKSLEDRLLILPDDDRDGVADRAITFAKVRNPTGFEFWGGGVIVASAPDLLFLKDTDGDDVADVRIHLLHGLDSADTHHAANNLIYGPDGNIYYQRGVFLVSNVETPWTKAKKHTTSGMYRFNPRTFEFAFHATNNPNPHGISFDYWGFHFATDGTGGQPYQVRPQLVRGFKMQQLLKKTVRPVASSGILSSAHFPDDVQGDFLLLNTIGFLGIKEYSLAFNDDGDAWGTHVADLIYSPKDRNFRPTDMEIGDDGALYVSDWQNIIIGHMQHNVRDPNRDHLYGRVFRVTAKGRPLMGHVAVDGQPIPVLLDLLKSPTDVIRRRVRIELSERRTADVVAALEKWLEQWDPQNPAHAHHLLEALWAYQQHNVQNRELLQMVLSSPEPKARIAAATVEQFWQQDPRDPQIEGLDPPEKVLPKLTPMAELDRRGLTAQERELYKLGAEVFVRIGHCSTCHQLDGGGLEKQYPPLRHSDWAQGDETRLIEITLDGLWGELTVGGYTYNEKDNLTPPMTAFRELMTDKEMAAVLTFVRNSFGNDARPVHPNTVARIRGQSPHVDQFHLVADLLKAHPFTDGERERNRNPGKAKAAGKGDERSP